MQKSLFYRPDIDGLRAAAVLSVVIYHFFPHALRGGFTGVDVFFVISGFLIARIIFTQLSENRFSFLDFYARRIRRIFPALIVVLIAAFLFGKIIFFDHEFVLLAKHVLAGAGFASNFLLWREAGYFDTASEFKPLLHLWSLGIEEQFYIAFPLLLWAAHKKHLRLFTLIAFLFLASFLANTGNVIRHPTATFYAPWTRVWELLAGALLARLTLTTNSGGGVNSFKIKALANFLDICLAKIFFTKKQETGATLPNFLSVLGLMLLLFGFLKIKAGMHFPGRWALIPVIGALCLIAAGENACFNRLILKNKLAIFIGRISYPLYLWHWPLLCYAKIYWGETLSRLVRLEFLAAAILLAFLTTKFIENPLRFGGLKRLKVAGLCVAMVALGSFGIWGMNLPAEKDIDARFVNPKKIVSQEDRWQFFGNRQADKKIIFFGDSHMQHFQEKLIDKLGDDFAIDSTTEGGCHFTIKNKWFTANNGESCEKIRQNVINASTPDIVINANYIPRYEAPKTPEEFYSLIMDKVALFNPPPKLMIFIGDPGEVDHLCEKAISRRLHRKGIHCPIQTKYFQAHLNFIKWSQSQTFPKFIKFAYPFLDLCDTQTGRCKIRNEKGQLLFWDTDHLTYVGGEKTAQKIAEIIYKEFPKE